MFLSSVVNNIAVVTTGSSSSTTSTYPNGGVETGDGSTPLDE